MALAVKDVGKSAEKYARRAGNAEQELKEGIEQSTKSWSANTKAAEGAYEAGVKEAISKKRFGRGVSRAGDAAQKDGALTKGVGRYREGVLAGVSKWAAGVAPHMQALASANLTPRRERGNPANIDRVKQVVEIQRKVAEARA